MHKISNTSINSRLLNPPFLVAARCGNLDSPRNGRVDLSGTTVGSTATYRCKNGFILANGDRIRECGANGRWSGTAPNCVCKLLTIKTLSCKAYLISGSFLGGSFFCAWVQ